MLKRILLAALWLPLLALAQSYPSPTYQNLTVLGNASISGALTVTGGNSIGLGALTQQAANTVLANATSSTANVTAFAMPSCSTSASALNWTSGTGFTCGTVASSGANSNITSLSGLTTPLSVAQGGTGRATLTAHGVLFGEGTAAINQSTAGSSGQPLLSGGASADPNWGTLNAANGGTGLTTITAHGVMLGEGTGNVATVGPCATTGQSIISQGATSDPVCGYPTGTLIGVQRFTSSGTYTPTTGTNSVIVEIQGGGGAGGGAPATAAGQVSTGSGGGAGGYIKHRMTSGFSGATVTIGSGGTGASGASGGNGGNTSFAGVTANGGSGGPVAAANSSVANSSGAAGGSASGGSILNIPGAASSLTGFLASPSLLLGGDGASSVLGSGGPRTANTATGNAASGFGAGGGGTQNGASQAVATGGAGSAGVVIVWEYN